VRTPHRITAAEFSDLLKHFLDTCCVLCGNTLCCAVCGTPIEHVRAALSVHNSASGSCQGPRIWTTAVPYCPRCEEEPERGGCLHFILNVFPKASWCESTQGPVGPNPGGAVWGAKSNRWPTRQRRNGRRRQTGLPVSPYCALESPCS